MAPITITHKGMPTVVSMPPVASVPTMAARGPMALATSLAPWANDSSAAEQIRGTTNRLLTWWRSLAMLCERLATRGLTMA